MKLVINIEKRHLAVFIFALTIFGMFMFALANDLDGSMPWHSGDDIAVDFGGAQQSLQNVFDTTDFATKDYVDYSVPSGMIVMWSGNIDDIPDGWKLCDGSEGTPDLTDRFVMSVSSGKDPGAIGGSNFYTLSTSQLPSHTHGSGSLVTDTAGEHQHLSYTIAYYTGTGGYSISGGGGWGYGELPPDGAHSHSITGSTGTTGSGSSIDNRPKYYALAFIMKE